MAERRKIIIETGAGEPLSTPHFDAEATLTARPVVPLTDQEAHRASYAAAPARAFWKRPALLIPIILAAVGIGIAAGFAIGIYRNRATTAQTPVAVAPTPAAENTDLSQTVQPPPAQAEVPEPETRAAIPEEKEEAKEEAKKEEPEEPAVVVKTEEREVKAEERERPVRTARRDEKDDDNNDDSRQPVAVRPPANSRERKPIKVDEYEIEDMRGERQAERSRRREERRDRRRRQRDDDFGIQRGVREADRIREIFEGRQP